MRRSIFLSFLLISALVSSAAWAGPPPAGCDTPPAFDTAGNSGILIKHSSGYTYGYNMDGISTIGEGGLPEVPAGYTLLGGSEIGWPDLDGNGVTDFVIQDASGYTYAYLMQDSGTFVSVLSEAAVPGLPDSAYSTIGFPDLNGDDNSDICIQHTGGFTYCYLMDGTTVLDEGQVPGLPTVDYATIGFPDLDGLNGGDIVIQHIGGYTYAYLMNGLTSSSDGAVPGPPAAGYSTIGFPDLDGLNGSDIVIQHTGGYTYAYLMNGLASSSDGPVPGPPAAGYSSIGFPDLNCDSNADVMIQHTGGYTYAYLMSGLTSTSDGAVPAPPTGYTTLPWEEAWSLLP